MDKSTLRRRAALLLPAGALCFTTRRASAAPADDVVRDVLPNGLVVLVEERRTADTVALQLAARAGSRDDANSAILSGQVLLGITFMTLRMLLQGTSRRPSLADVQRAAAQVGGTIGGGAGTELSNFSSVMPSDAAALGFDLLADLATDPLLAEDTLARQKQITLQDLAQRRADPPTLLSDLFQVEMFAGHPAGAPIIGTPESIQAITREALLATRERAWGAANLALAIVGRIATADAFGLARRYFSALPAGAAVQRPPAQPRPIDAPRAVFAEAGQQQVQFRLGTAAPPVATPDYYPLVVLNNMLGGTSGRLFAELRTARGLAYTAGSGYSALADTGAWYATAGVDPENLGTAVAVTRAEIERLRQEPPDAEEVARKIRQITGRQVLAEESNAARAARRVSQELLGTDSVEEFVRRIREVTPDDVLRVARTYLDLNHSLLAVVGPQTAAPLIPLAAPPAPAAAPATVSSGK